MTRKSALFYWRAQLIFWFVVLVGFAADRGTKSWAVEQLAPTDHQQSVEHRVISVWGDYVCLELTGNAGAVWGIAGGKRGFLITTSLAAMVFLLWLFFTSKPNHYGLHIALSLLLAGALGNLYDRVCHDGLVIDFIKINLGVWPANPWPTFNLADVFICLGIGLFLLLSLRHHKSSVPSSDPSQSTR